MSRIDAPPERLVLDVLGAALRPRGFNLIGTASVRAYDAGVPAAYALRRMMPEAETAIVVGNGGAALWDAYRDFVGRHPEHAALAEPLDAYTERVVAEAVAPLAGRLPLRVLHPFRFPAEPVSFPRLATCAGLGRPGLVGVLLHPEFGPWIALRAAILVPLALAAPRPADGFDPCPGCVERACIPACPAGAVGSSGWDVPRCAAHRARADDPCASRCHARVACVLAPHHRYPAEALAYHQATARPALLAFAAGRPPGPVGES